MEKLIRKKSKDKSGDIFINSIRIQIFLWPSENTYKAVIKKKDGTEFVAFAGYPHEAVKLVAESLASKINHEDLIYGAWE